jgi:hypothetical protein
LLSEKPVDGSLRRSGWWNISILTLSAAGQRRRPAQERKRADLQSSSKYVDAGKELSFVCINSFARGTGL